jgi:competence ComEA-like helix-hairpin-helix protein
MDHSKSAQSYGREERLALAIFAMAVLAGSLWMRMKPVSVAPPGPDGSSPCYFVSHPVLDHPILACGAVAPKIGLPKACEGRFPVAMVGPCDTIELGGGPDCPVLQVRSTAAAPRLLCGWGIDLNRDLPRDLEALPGVGPVRARDIVEERERHGPFESLMDLSRVKGIGEKTVQRIAPFVVDLDE